MTSLTRGPLPAGVYWRRRLAVLGIALLLVVGLARMFGGGDDGDPRATPVSATRTSAAVTPTPTPTATTGAGTAGSSAPTPGATAGATPGATAVTTPAAPAPTTPPPLPAPTGRCSDDDVVVAPSITGAQATRTVPIRLTLRTRATTACTWRVSASSVQLKISSGSDRVWSTIDCPRAVPTQDVVVRRDSDAVVTVAWNSRRSDEDCSGHTKWAMPGYYHVAVAALGGEPQDIQFALRKPTPVAQRTAPAAPRGTTPAAPAASTGARQEPQGDPQRFLNPTHPVD